MDVAHQSPLSMGYPRQECWSGLPFASPEHLPDPETEPLSPALQVDSLSLSHQGPLLWLNLLFGTQGRPRKLEFSYNEGWGWWGSAPRKAPQGPTLFHRDLCVPSRRCACIKSRGPLPYKVSVWSLKQRYPTWSDVGRNKMFYFSSTQKSRWVVFETATADSHRIHRTQSSISSFLPSSTHGSQIPKMVTLAPARKEEKRRGRQASFFLEWNLEFVHIFFPHSPLTRTWSSSPICKGAREMEWQPCVQLKLLFPRGTRYLSL